MFKYDDSVILFYKKYLNINLLDVLNLIFNFDEKEGVFVEIKFVYKV